MELISSSLITSASLCCSQISAAAAAAAASNLSLAFNFSFSLGRSVPSNSLWDISTFLGDYLLGTCHAVLAAGGGLKLSCPLLRNFGFGVLGRSSSSHRLTFFTKVDESQLSEDCSLPPPPSYPGRSSPYVQMALPGGGIVSMPLDQSSSGVCSSPDQASQASIGPDVLSVSAGEPVTHFNLDQLLEIVQSFQLDTATQAQEGDPAQKKVLGGLF